MPYSCSEILFSHKKKWTTACHDMDEPRKHYVKQKKPVKDHILYDFVYVKYK